MAVMTAKAGVALVLASIVGSLLWHGYYLAQIARAQTADEIANKREAELEIVANAKSLTVTPECRTALLEAITARGYQQGAVKPGPNGLAIIGVVDDWGVLSWVCD